MQIMVPENTEAQGNGNREEGFLTQPRDPKMGVLKDKSGVAERRRCTKSSK